MKNKYVIYIALVVLVFVAGIFAYRILQPSATPEPENIIGTAPGRGFNRTANVLGFDNEQRQRFNELEHSYRTELAGLMHEMHEIEAEILMELSKEQPNRKALEKYAAETGIVQTGIKQLTIDHFLNIKEICSPEQAENLSSLFNEMQRGFGQGKGHGRRPGRGQGLRKGQIEK
jgi:Spy/CpxP family protein refolding chaperone